jgi:hypothetical protein
MLREIEVRRSAAPVSIARVGQALAGQFARAKEIVEAHRQEVERIAEAPLARQRLSGDELRDLMAQQPRLRPVVDAEVRAGEVRPQFRTFTLTQVPPSIVAIATASGDGSGALPVLSSSRTHKARV